MKKLLIKLGILKMSHDEYLKKLKGLYELISTVIVKKKNLPKDIFHESLSEIKIYFFSYQLRLLKSKLSNDLFNKTMRYFISDILFSTIDKAKYSDEFRQSFLEERVDYHDNGIHESNDAVANIYYEKLMVLWFKKPFSTIEEIEKYYLENSLSGDYFEKSLGLIEIMDYSSEFVAILSDGTLNLIKRTAK